MLKVIKNLLNKIIDDIDVGNSNITEEEAVEMIRIIKSYTDKTQKLSKYQAYRFLNMSRAKFDNLVREGKLPKGIKVAGFKEKFWTEKDLSEFLKKFGNDNKKKN